MVKPLRYCGKALTYVSLMLVATVLALALWLHQGERSLNMMKPWILSTLNHEQSPYTVTFSDVSIDWRNVALLGKMRIKNIVIAKRDGNVFAQFPEIYATIDPLGFLPNHSLLHKVILHAPRIFVIRNAQGIVELGIEDSPSRLALSDGLAFVATANTASDLQGFQLPFGDFIIENAQLTFNDEASQTDIVSKDFAFRLKRHGKSYDALLSMPFTVDEQKVTLVAGLSALAQKNEHVLAVQLKQFPARLICLFDTCPKGMHVDGLLDASLALGILDQDVSLQGFRAEIATKKSTVTALDIFAEPLTLTQSNLAVEGDWAKKELRLTHALLQLPDTTITARGKAHKANNGWYVEGSGEATRLNVDKIYKYWPLVMAPDSRKWIIAKLKSGYAEKGTLKLNLTPEDFAADFFPQHSIDAMADARDITFEYLPGFPLVEKMNGIAHFTATTVKVEGGGGHLLSGSTIKQATLWCPQLLSGKNPMEASIKVTSPATDVAKLLAIKHFKFDDPLALDAGSIRGTVDAEMHLKFNAFSGKEHSSPDDINLEAVDYDIQATLKDLGQKKIYGAYDLKSLNGTLNAANTGMQMNGSVLLGDLPVQDVKLAQENGKPLTLAVKGRASKMQPVVNDFNVVYALDHDVPKLTLRGQRLDVSASMGSGGTSSIFSNFPAMILDINLVEFFLNKEMPFTQVSAKLQCTKTKCESGDLSAKAGKATIRGTIGTSAGARRLTLTSNNAGSFLTALGITDRVSNGSFAMNGIYSDAKTPSALNAQVLMTDFTLKNSQILGRILSIGSLTGLANALTGSGISFDKFAATMLWQSGVATLEKSLASGNAIGITVEGTVNMNTSLLALKGVLVPAYALNSLVGNIPLIGLLAGGEGEGLIAFNYWVRGNYNDPEVGVNPLSGLTPGFLRGIFGIFDDAPAKTPDEKSGESKLAPPMKNRR